MSVSRTCPTCGYTAQYATRALADAHHRRHSCVKHRRLLAQARGQAELLRARVIRNCDHPRAEHRHGTRAAYVKDRCRCTDCTAANTAASRTVARERLYGRWHPYVDAGSVRDHLVALRAAGIGVQRIAHLAGLSVSHVRQLSEPQDGDGPGGTRRVRPNTATRVLNVRIDDANRARSSRIDGTGTARRLQALVSLGWPPGVLADRLGRRSTSLHRSMKSRSVTARTAHEVATLYQQLWNASPPRTTVAERAAADAAKASATAQGWLPPLAWDDIDSDPTPPATTDAPESEHVDEIAVERALAGDHIGYGDLTSTEQAEVIGRLSARGRSIRDIAMQLGTTKRTVSRRRASRGAA